MKRYPKAAVYNKLVRDRLPEICAETGSDTVTFILDSQTYSDELNRKLLEEVNEFVEEGGEVSELADILEVIYSIASARGSSPGQLEKQRIEISKSRGSFNDRLFLIETLDGA